MRVVLDPGVFVSGLISRSGSPAQILDLWAEAAIELVVSPALLDELSDVIFRPKFSGIIRPAAGRMLLEELRVRALFVDDPPATPAVTSDPDDDYLVALARSAQADAIISGDRHLTTLPAGKPRVLTPRAFVDLLDSLGEHQPPT